MILKTNFKIASTVLKMYSMPTALRSISTSWSFPTNQTPSKAGKSPQSSVASSELNVPGLSSAVVRSEEPVGPGAKKDGEYKVPEYFNYNTFSYFEAEVEMTKFRLTQPSALKK